MRWNIDRLNTPRTLAIVAALALGAPSLALAQGTSTSANSQMSNGQSGSTATTAGVGQQNGNSQGSLGKNALQSMLKNEGYSDFSNMHKSGNHYTTDAKRYGTQERNIKIDAATGQVSNPQKLSRNQVKSLLRHDGYSDVSDVSHSNGDFTAKAKQNGHQEKLQVDSHTGMVTPQNG